ncbi:DUF4240 domain-containing protein [Kitasatospora sp. NPDC015120]|uniref:DUF4240 domain-containing protein n=1 Tax=Kitasatospora sp. NPDC015120 TaxID=3364023 RepID=UPI0036F487E6
MDRSEFWRIVDSSVSPDMHETVTRIEEKLESLSGDEITSFHDRLSEVLFDLDRRDLNEAGYSFSGAYEADGQGDDDFLFARCAVVVSGSKVYQEVLKDPSAFATAWDWCGQDVLNVIEEAYEEVTGDVWEHDSPVDYETGSNTAAW